MYMCMALWSNEMNKLNINMVKMDTEFPLRRTHIMAFYIHVLCLLFEKATCSTNANVIWLLENIAIHLVHFCSSSGNSSKVKRKNVLSNSIACGVTFNESVSLNKSLV